MAKMDKILQVESERSTKALCRRITLFHEGSFYRAYEWSAWLFVRHKTEYQVTHRELKSRSMDYVLIGFPQEQLGRWVGTAQDVVQTEDGMVQFSVPEGDGGDAAAPEPEVQRAAFEEWKQSFPLSVPSSAKHGNEESRSAAVGSAFPPAASSAAPAVGLLDILRRLLAVEVEGLTPMQCQAELRALQRTAMQMM